MAPGARVNLAELVPDLLPYLGQAAYLQLDAFESFARVVTAVPSLAAKEKVTLAAAKASSKYQGLVAEIRRHDGDPVTVMLPFSASVGRFQRVTGGVDWREDLLGAYVTGGLLDDFFIRLAEGLPRESGSRISQLLGADGGQAGVIQVLQDAIAADSRLASRLALWGRRLVGDTLLVARGALHLSENPASDQQRIEPVLTELIAAHTRRMDTLGLTA